MPEFVFRIIELKTMIATRPCLRYIVAYVSVSVMRIGKKSKGEEPKSQMVEAINRLICTSKSQSDPLTGKASQGRLTGNFSLSIQHHHPCLHMYDPYTTSSSMPSYVRSLYIIIIHAFICTIPIHHHHPYIHMYNPYTSSSSVPSYVRSL